jgi:hypothetical protein
MRDIVFVAIALAFFALSYLYVLGCDRIIGREGSAPETTRGVPLDGRTTGRTAGAEVPSS